MDPALLVIFLNVGSNVRGSVHHTATVCVHAAQPAGDDHTGNAIDEQVLPMARVLDDATAAAVRQACWRMDL
jgi:hypothetical protein